MVVSAASFSDWILAVHIVAVVVAFGVVFTYPLVLLVLERRDRRALPAFHHIQVAISRRIINPGLLVVVVAGIYLASDLHDWQRFFVGWGLAVAIVLGGLEGAFMIPREKRLAELSARDVAAAPVPGSGSRVAMGSGVPLGSGEVVWSEEYLKLRSQVGGVGAVMSLLVVVTVFVMALGAPG
ncbi:MAG: hypothetical protein LC685_04220 [Actinobacteria bacterium]|nr:hypothetical protein [Actinomycetota bacterium]